MTRVEFIFDFASPNAYFAYRALPAIAKRAGATITYTPVLLGGIFKQTGNQPPMMVWGNVKAKFAYEQLDMQRFMERHAITKFQFNPNFPVNTLSLMRGAVAAQLDGGFDAYLEAGFAAMWENAKNMADPEVFAEVMTSAGFDAAALAERIQSPSVKAKLMENTQDAVDRGVFGAPTFFVGGEMYFGKDRLAWVEEALVAVA